jgi:hypothetical protein
MAAVRRRTRRRPGDLIGHSDIRPPTDVMAITSLPRKTGTKKPRMRRGFQASFDGFVKM